MACSCFNPFFTIFVNCSSYGVLKRFRKTESLKGEVDDTKSYTSRSRCEDILSAPAENLAFSARISLSTSNLVPLNRNIEFATKGGKHFFSQFNLQNFLCNCVYLNSSLFEPINIDISSNLNYIVPAVQHERGPRNSTLRRQMALYFKDSEPGPPGPPVLDLALPKVSSTTTASSPPRPTPPAHLLPTQLAQPFFFTTPLPKVVLLKTDSNQYFL